MSAIEELCPHIDNDDDRLLVYILIEEGNLLRAISLVRSDGMNLITAAKLLRKIAKDDLNKDIFTFI